jgi:hypothetical protein
MEYLIIFTFFDTLREWIAGKTIRTATYWIMIAYYTISIQTTSTLTRIITFLIDTS